MTKVVLISDTHGLHRSMNLPDGDILVHAGDLTAQGNIDELNDLNDWFAAQTHQHKIVIAGNHDFCFERENAKSRKALNAVTYLQDEAIEVMGLNIYGSPWQPRFFDWAFNLDRGEELARVWAKIPDHTQILVTHGPPFGILDRTAAGLPVGCEDLLERIQTLKPMIHVFGHIHEAYGHLQLEGSHFVNASICNLGYRPVNKPIVIDV